MSKSNELTLIPKYEKYMQYIIEVIIKMPRTEKFNIGNEYKSSMYQMLEDTLHISKIQIIRLVHYLLLMNSSMLGVK